MCCSLSEIITSIQQLGISGVALYLLYKLYDKSLDQQKLLSEAINKLSDRMDALCRAVEKTDSSAD